MGEEKIRLNQNWGCKDSLLALNTTFNFGNALMNYFNEIIKQYLITRKSAILFATCKRGDRSKAFVSPCGMFSVI